MGRREDLIEKMRAILDTPGDEGREVYVMATAERQALALEGIEDLLRANERAGAAKVGVWTGCGWQCACAGAAGDNDDKWAACDTCGYGRPSAPLRPGSETSRALIAVTENAMPTEAWKKAAFSVKTYEQSGTVVVLGPSMSFEIRETARVGTITIATKLAALLNRHWGE